MKCLILAAGYATRLYPLTQNFPKPLLEVCGKTIIDWLVDDIDTTGRIDEYVVISNHRFATHFESWAQAKPQRITVVDDGTSTNDTRLGAVRDIQYAIDQLRIDDDMLVVAGDNVLDFSMARFVDYAMQKQTSCVMRFYVEDLPTLRKSGVLAIDADDRVGSMVEKPAEPQSNWCCPPFYYYTRDDARLVAEGIASGCGTDAPGSYIAWLCTRTPVHAMLMPGRRYDIGDVASYEEVKRTYHGIVS